VSTVVRRRVELLAAEVAPAVGRVAVAVVVGIRRTDDRALLGWACEHRLCLRRR